MKWGRKLKPIRIALTGPMHSGKTTLAKYLEDTEKFALCNYTDTLKKLLVIMLNEIDYAQLANLPRELTVADVKANKAKYRPMLQELGTLLGFDNGGYVDVVTRVLKTSGMPAVFDNVRFASQLEMLKPRGFKLVRFVDSNNVCAQRGIAVNPEHIAEQVVSDPDELLLLVGTSLEFQVEQIKKWWKE